MYVNKQTSFSSLTMHEELCACYWCNFHIPNIKLEIKNFFFTYLDIKEKTYVCKAFAYII